MPTEIDREASSAVLDLLATQLVDGITAASADLTLLIRVLKGEPSDTELAALIAVLAAASSATPNPPHSPVSHLGEWGTPINQLRYGLSTAPAHFVNARYSR